MPFYMCANSATPKHPATVHWQPAPLVAAPIPCGDCAGTLAPVTAPLPGVVNPTEHPNAALYRLQVAKALTQISKPGSKAIVAIISELGSGRNIRVTFGGGFYEFTPADFIAIWTGLPALGVKRDQKVVDVFKDAFRDPATKHGEAVDGKHEWIPCNMMGELVDHLTQTAPQLLTKWAFLQDVLRTPTDVLILKPWLAETYYDNSAHYANVVAQLQAIEKAAVPKWHALATNPKPTWPDFLRGELTAAGLDRASILNLQGHVGAVYLYDPNKAGAKQDKTQQTEGTNQWHDALRDLAAANWQQIASYVAFLDKFIGDTCWAGDLPGISDDVARAILCDYYEGPGASAALIAPTLYDLAQRQATKWQQSMQLQKVNVGLVQHIT